MIMLCEKLLTFVCGIVSAKLPVRALNVNSTRVDHTSFPVGDQPSQS